MPKTFRACWSSYVVLTICIGITPAIALLFVLHGAKNAGWVVAVGFAALLFTCFWLSRFKLTITPHSLTYSSLFAGERTIHFSELTRSDIAWVGTGGVYTRPLLQLVSHGKATRINFKVFSREAVVALFHLVGPNQALESTTGRSDD